MRCGFFQETIEQKIEKPAPAEHPKSDFGGERSVIRGYAGAKLCVEHVACIRAFSFDAAQYFKCDRSSGADGHATMKSHPRRSEKEWPRRLRDTEEKETETKIRNTKFASQDKVDASFSW